jgi:formylglycine-generating enzyme required for sulfatase activity
MKKFSTRVVILLLALLAVSGTQAQEQNDLRRLAPGTVFRDCTDCPEMVVVPPGNFSMGSPDAERGRDKDREGPVHPVTLSRTLGVGKYEVTKAQFARFAQETGFSSSGGCYAWNGEKVEHNTAKSWLNPGFAQTENDPVVCVSWDDAKAYTQWLARKTGKAFRLLSEAEWEYAARAGSRSSRPWGDDPRLACRYANVADTTAKNGVPGFSGLAMHECDDGHAYTAPVGSYQPNAFGLYDMIGNVWEWTEDCWNETYAGAPGDGSARTAGDCDRRVLRGGSWDVNPEVARSAYRGGDAIGLRDVDFGFRVARTQ